MSARTIWRRTPRSQRDISSPPTRSARSGLATKAHLLVEVDAAERPGDGLLRQEDRAAVQAALARLSEPERELLVAHEVDGETTATLASQRGTTAGAVAAQLARIRAQLRVEYLLVHESVEPPTDRCRPVLRAISAADRRRIRELDAHGHLLGCSTCAALARSLTTRSPARSTSPEVHVPISKDADVVTARQKGKEIAAPLGFSTTDCTIIATAISEVARNIVKFARRGEVMIDVVQAKGKDGVRVVARDAGPGIPDLDRALEDGYSTYRRSGTRAAGMPPDHGRLPARVDTGGRHHRDYEEMDPAQTGIGTTRAQPQEENR